MPTQRYPLEPGGPKRLVVTTGWRTATVSLDDEELVAMSSQRELKAGREVPLPDGSTLSIRLHTAGGSSELRLLRNGEPLPGSASDPQTRITTAAGVLVFVAVIGVVLGAAAELLEVPFLAGLGLGWRSVAGAAILGLLSAFVRRRSLAALRAAIVLLITDLVATVVLVPGGEQLPLGGLLARVFLLVPLFQGAAAMRAARSDPQDPSPAS